jgi:acyl carrier protein
MTRTDFVRALEEILGLERRTLRMEGSRENIEAWTSLADVQIFSLIESEFAIEPNEDLIGAETVADLLRVLQDRGAFRE